MRKTPTWMKILLLSLVISLVIGKFKPIPINSTSIIQHSPSIESSSGHSSCFTTVDPIIINNASDWVNYSFISGNGTEKNPYIIEGIEIIGNDSDFEFFPDYEGIYIQDSESSIIIQNSYIHNFHVGIHFRASFSDITPCRIESNIIEHCGIGIRIHGVNFLIINNRISECHAMEKNLLALLYSHVPEDVSYYGGAGIQADFDYGVNISSNIILNCDIGAALSSQGVFHHNRLSKCGLLLDWPSWDAYYSIENNSVNELPLGFFTPLNVNQTENEILIIDGNVQQYGQLIVRSLTNIAIKNINICDTNLGFLLEYNYNLTISDCTADHCLFGMYISESPPLLKGKTGYMNITGIHILNCFIGIQTNLLELDNEEVNFDVSIKISEFSNNQYDILLVDFMGARFSITVPIGSTVYLDTYFLFHLQLFYNDLILNSSDSQLQNHTSIFSPHGLNATVLHLNHLGQYHILLGFLIGDEWVAYWNVTINVVEIPIEKKKIGAYAGLWLSSTLGISLVCITIYMRKRRITVHKT